MPELRKIAADLTHKLRHISGAFVEDKGLMLSVHYRRVAPVDREQVWRTVLATLEQEEDRFCLTMGAKVYEIRPHLRWNKGAAVTWIKEQLGHPETLVIYMGDDVTDEDAFCVLPDAVTVKIADSAETAAQYLLSSPLEAQRFLEWIGQLLREQSGSAASPV